MHASASIMLLGDPCVCGADRLKNRRITPLSNVEAPSPEADLSLGGAVFLRGDVHDWLKNLVAGGEKFDACVTSVPYWGSRRYTPDSDREVGTEPLSDYLENLRFIFERVASVMNDGGLLWVNVGDTAVGSGGAGGDYNKGGGYEGRERYRQSAPTVGGRTLAKGQWANVPGRLACALQDSGWLLRSSIVWAKTHPRRESLDHVRRPKMQHEMVYMFSRVKAGETCFNPDGIRGVEEGDVWHIDVARGDEANGKAPWPSALVERMLACMAPKNGQTAPTPRVLDPFVGGSGNLYLAGRRLGWDVVGIDADPEACASAVAACPWVKVV